MAGESAIRLRVLYRLSMPDSGPVRYWTHAEIEPSGVVMEESAGGASKFWEPRVIDGGDLLIQDVGGLLEGIPLPTEQSLTVLVNPDTRAGLTSLYDDLFDSRLEGATLDVYVGETGSESFASLTHLWSGQVPTGGVEIDVLAGLMVIRAQESIPLDAPIGVDVWDASVLTNLPEASDNKVQPVAFGPSSGGTTVEFWVYLTAVDLTVASARTYRIGNGTPGNITGYGSPAAVRVSVGGGAYQTITAASPITAAPAADQWGSWVSTTTQIVINDGSATYGIDQDTVVQAKILGCDRSSSTRPADNGEVLETMFIAAGVGATKLTGLAAWVAALPAGMDVHGIWPDRRSDGPITLRDVLHEVMISTLSLLRRASGQRYEPIDWTAYEGSGAAADHTIYQDELIDCSILVDPWDEYANAVQITHYEPGRRSDVRIGRLISDTAEQTATGRIVTMSLDVRARTFAGLNGLWEAQLARQQIVSVVTVGAGRIGVRPGDSIIIQAPHLASRIGSAKGHVRRVEVDVRSGLVRLWTWHPV